MTMKVLSNVTNTYNESGSYLPWMTPGQSLSFIKLILNPFSLSHL